MTKINKSDTTPEMEQADADARDRMKTKKCQHFAEDTYVMYDNRRGKVLLSLSGLLLVEWKDGTVGELRPHALNRRF